MADKQLKFETGQRILKHTSNHDEGRKGTILHVSDDHIVIQIDHSPGKTYITVDKWDNIELLDEGLVDYTNHRFYENFVLDGCIGYISVNQEMYFEENGLTPSSYYHIFCTHPRRGSCTFRVEKDEDANWICEIKPNLIDADFIDWIGEKIMEHHRR